MVQATLSSHAILPRPPHLPQRCTHIHMLMKQPVRLINRERNKPSVPIFAARRVRKQERARLVGLVLLLFWFGRRWWCRGWRCGLLVGAVLALLLLLLLLLLILLLGEMTLLLVNLVVMVVMAHGNGRVGSSQFVRLYGRFRRLSRGRLRHDGSECRVFDGCFLMICGDVKRRRLHRHGCRFD